MADDESSPALPARHESANAQVSPAIVSEWLQTQNRQIDAQARATELQCQQDNHAFEYGKLALAAQKEDRVHERENSRKSQRDRLIFLAILASLIVAVIITAIALNKTQIALELVKAVLYIAAGAIGGYGFGKTRGAKRDSDAEHLSDVASDA